MRYSNITPLQSLFRSPTTLEVLVELFVNPVDELSVNDVAIRVGAPQPTVSRELARLERAGILRSRRVGQMKLVSPDPRLPFLAALRRLVVEATGGLSVIAEELADVEHVEAAFVLGAYAAFLVGERPAERVEITLLVIGDPDLADLDAAAARIEDAVGVRVALEVRLPGEEAPVDGGDEGVVGEGPAVVRVPIPAAGEP